METTNNTARTAQTETLSEVLIRCGYLKPKADKPTQEELLVAVLDCIQTRKTEWYILMADHYDWLVVMQCLQDNHLFPTNAQRQPFSAFEKWIREKNVHQRLAKCSMRNISYANNKIRGARYPWADVAWEPAVLRRWRVLYRTLNSMLQEVVSNDPSYHN